MSDPPLYHGHGWDIRLETTTVPDGRTKTTARAHTCDTVHLLAFRDPSTILLLHEYRPFYKEYVWMIPSGKVDKETDVLAAAQRELQEETGFRGRSLMPYFVARHTERVAYQCHVFIARDIEPDPLPQDAHELIEVHTLSLDEAIQRVLSSSILHSISALTLLRFKHDGGMRQ